MDNRPSCSKSKRTQDECECRGNTNIGSAEKVHIDIRIDKSTTNINSSPEGPTTEPKEETISCCKKVTGGVKHCDEFKEKLQEFYRKLTLPKVAWIKEGADLSLVDHFIQLELEVSKGKLEKVEKEQIALEKIFQPINDRRPTRILIEGQPGFGKTTLAMKLAHDWATGKSYIDFKFVFFVPLQDLHERSAEDAILEIGKRCDFHNNMQIFNFHMKDTLLILDGFDEISPDARTEINKILYKQLYSDVTVILFCRTNTFEVTHEERRQLFGVDGYSGIFHDKKITSLGVKSEQKKRTFLEKFLPKSRVDNLVKCLFPVLSVSPESKQWELFNSPLILMLLSIIMQQDETIERIATRTQFYKQLFNCILKHSYRKHGYHIASDFDLFGLDSAPNAIQQSLKQFGIVSLRNIIEYNLQFESNELTDEIHNLGFLIKHRELTFISSRNHYEGLHQSFLEFAAAFGLWLNLKFKTDASVENDLKLIVTHYINRRTSLVLRFLVSLMENELDLLLSQIESFSVWFRLNFNMAVNLFSECQSNHFSKSKCLRNFIPYSIDLQGKRQCERKLLELLEYGSECGQIETIAINKKTDSEIFTIKIAPCCQIATLFNFRYNTSCRVFGSMHHFRTIPFDLSMSQLLHFAASTNSEIEYYTFWLCISPEFYNLIMEKKVLSQIKFRYLKIKINSKLDENVIIQLLQNDQVAHLVLRKDKRIEFDIRDVCCAAAKSIQLTRISLEGFTVDLYDLTAAGTKSYTFISLTGCSLTCRHPLTFEHCCNNLEIRHIRHVNEFPADATQILITRGCDDKMLSYFLGKCPKSANVIPATSIDFFDYYTNMGKHLQTLIIDSFRANADVKKLATCIHNLPIVNLMVCGTFDLKTLFEHMNNLWAADNTSRLKTIIYKDLLTHSATCVLKDLIEGLKRNHWQRVCIHSVYESISRVSRYLMSSNLCITPGNYELICAEFGFTSTTDKDLWDLEWTKQGYHCTVFLEA